jgi:hypothetical protein
MDVLSDERGTCQLSQMSRKSRAVPPSPFRYFNSSPEVTLAIKDRNASFRERFALHCQHRHLVCNFPDLGDATQIRASRRFRGAENFEPMDSRLWQCLTQLTYV